MKPLVTLLLPTLNRTTYLREALDSVLAQDYPNLDILISDNGSSNETPEFVRSIVNGDPRVRFRRNDVTVPIYDHFNQLVQEVRGEYFLVVCDDDVITPTFVSEVVGVATRHPDIKVVVSVNVTMDQRGNVLREYGQPESEVVDGVDFVSHWLYERSPSVLRLSRDDAAEDGDGPLLRGIPSIRSRPEHRQYALPPVRHQRAGGVCASSRFQVARV